jgi:hypothetical protein
MVSDDPVGFEVAGGAWLVKTTERLFRETSFSLPSGRQHLAVIIVCLTLLLAFGRAFSTLTMTPGAQAVSHSAS